MSYFPEFSELVESHLNRWDRSSSWLASRLRVNPATVGRWLNAETRPGSPEMVVRIADVLRIDKVELLTAAGYGYQEGTSHEQEVSHAQSEPSTKLEQVGYYPNFSNLVAQTLTENNYSIVWLAKQLNIAAIIVSRWLNAETRPGNPELVVHISSILQIDKTQLLIAAGYGYQEKIEQEQQNPVVEPEQSLSKSPTFETQAELEECLRLLAQSFGEKLSEYSKRRGYSQIELAQHLNFSPAAVSQWRTGARIPNAKTVHKIIQTLDPLSQDEMDQFLQAWAHSKLANDLSDYLAAASDDPMSVRALEKLLQNL